MNSWRLRAAALALLLAAMAGVVPAAMGHGGQHERHDTMTALGKQMKALGRITRGEAAVDGAAQQDAAGIVEISRRLPALFPGGSGGPKTRARDLIWSDRAGFERAAADFEKAAPDLLQAVRSGERAAIAAALQAVGRTCSDCHDHYRRPEQ